jgi:L-amino acid N-acyltransferase
MRVRDATAADLRDILHIYNHAVEATVATFDVEPWREDERREWLAGFGGEHPLLVCEVDGQVVGFAYYQPYRPRRAYAATKETTIYVDPSSQRCGVGTALYRALIERARAHGVHALVGVLGGENPGSQALHRKLGFELVGHLREVGYKFDRWVDTYVYELLLDPVPR